MTSYLYRVISGASTFGEGQPSLREAERTVVAMRVQYPQAEVERIEQTGPNTRRYWVRKRRKWTVEFWIDYEKRRPLLSSESSCRGLPKGIEP